MWPRLNDTGCVGKGGRNPISRRQFLKKTGGSGSILAGLLAASTVPSWFAGWIRGAQAVQASDDVHDLIKRSPIARYWTSTNAATDNCALCHAASDALQQGYRHPQTIIRCLLCAQECMLTAGQRGKCRARVHVDGKLRSLVYGRPVAMHVDPIEKKPFYHFRPGTRAFSLATVGCPLNCKFCQNWEISQARPEDYPGPFVAPEAIVAGARRQQAPIIAYTYTEPTVFTEYLLDIARWASTEGIDNVLISCGFMNTAPLSAMCECLDAVKIDLKGFSRDFYRRVCGAELKPVLRSIRQVARSGVHLEIVNLVVPTLNDSHAMLDNLTDWVIGELGPDVPLHFTRFHPDYQMPHLPPTPAETLEKAYEIAKAKGIRYPYVGNVPGHRGNHTYCPYCGKMLVARTGFFVSRSHVVEGRCAYCRMPIAGVWP